MMKVRTVKTRYVDSKVFDKDIIVTNPADALDRVIKKSIKEGVRELLINDDLPTDSKYREKLLAHHMAFIENRRLKNKKKDNLVTLSGMVPINRCRGQKKMTKYVKLPIEIEATQWFKDGDHPEVKPHPQALEGKFFISTLEGYMRVIPGDWIVTGIKGEYYPVKDEIFKATYQEVDDEQKPF